MRTACSVVVAIVNRYGAGPRHDVKRSHSHVMTRTHRSSMRCMIDGEVSTSRTLWSTTTKIVCERSGADDQI